MQLKALRNILVNGQHFDEGAVFETDADTASKLVVLNRCAVVEDQPKQPENATFGSARRAKK